MSQMAVILRPRTVPSFLTAAVHGGLVALGAGLLVLDGPPEPLRRDAGQDGLGGAVRAVAEAAAHVGDDDSYLVLGVAEQGADCLAEAVDALSGLVEGELAGGVGTVGPP